MPCLLAVLSFCSIAPGFAADSKRPNIILIFIDRLTAGDLSCYGGSDISTPNIDSMAQKSVRLADYHSVSPSISASQYSLLTGQYYQRLKHIPVKNNEELAALSGDRTTLAGMLKQFGYRAGMFGPWLLGGGSEQGPRRHGFDDFAGNFSETPKNQAVVQDESIALEADFNEWITSRAMEWVDHHKNETIFMILNYPTRQSVSSTREDYIKTVGRIDEGIGRVLNTLRTCGFEKNSILLISSFTGTGYGSTNENSRRLNETDLKIPCLIQWTGVLPAGAVSNQSSIVMDLSYTLLNAAMIRPGHHIDGISLIPYLLGIRREAEQTFIWRDAPTGEKAVRWGKWKWLKTEHREYLFNLSNDPTETANRFQQNIDIVHWLRDIYDQWEEEMKK